MTFERLLATQTDEVVTESYRYHMEGLCIQKAEEFRSPMAMKYFTDRVKTIEKELKKRDIEV